MSRVGRMHPVLFRVLRGTFSLASGFKSDVVVDFQSTETSWSHGVVRRTSLTLRIQRQDMRLFGLPVQVGQPVVLRVERGFNISESAWLPWLHGLTSRSV